MKITITGVSNLMLRSLLSVGLSLLAAGLPVRAADDQSESGAEWEIGAGKDDVATRGNLTAAAPKIVLAPQAGSMDELARGLSKYDRGDLKGALEDINKAILRDPLNTQAFFYRGLVRESLGDEINAVADFDQNRIAAFDSIVLSEKGFCQTKMYELLPAMVSLNKSLALDHHSSDAALTYSRRAMLKRLMHNSNDAVADCDRAIALVPGHLEARWQRAVTYCTLKKYPSAVVDLQFVVHSAPSFADAHFNLAECLRVMGKSGEAFDEYKKALALYTNQNNGTGKQAVLKRLASFGK